MSITAHYCIFIIPKLVPIMHINYVSESETDNNLDPMNFKDAQSGQWHIYFMFHFPPTNCLLFMQ